jgi:hypothetical protein
MDIDLIIAGTSYSLTDGTYCYVQDYDGWGEAPLHRLEERGPQQHGVSDVGYRLDPRVGSLVLWVQGISASDMWAKRAAVLSLVRPTTAIKRLRWTLDNGSVRQFDVHSLGQMSMGQREQQGMSFASGLMLRAPDPTCYDPTACAVTFALGGGGTAFTVPTDVPTQVGASTINASASVTYTGTWRTYPVLRITGPITDCTITNASTDETLDFDGTTIEDGDYYEIDLRYGNKTVVDAAGTNKVADLTSDSDLATWHLADDQEVTDGLNAITVTGTGVTGATRVTMTYFVRYTGI